MTDLKNAYSVAVRRAPGHPLRQRAIKQIAEELIRDANSAAMSGWVDATVTAGTADDTAAWVAFRDDVQAAMLAELEARK